MVPVHRIGQDLHLAGTWTASRLVGWFGGDPHGHGNGLEVGLLATPKIDPSAEDDPLGLRDVQAWIAGEGAINRPLEGCGPVGCYTLVGGQAWGIDRLTGLAEATT